MQLFKLTSDAAKKSGIPEICSRNKSRLAREAFSRFHDGYDPKPLKIEFNFYVADLACQDLFQKDDHR